MIVLTWNLGRRTHPGQVELIRQAGADIVAFQEVSAQRYPTLARELAGMGLVHQHGGPTTARSFPFASMIASRWIIRDPAAEGLDVPFPERVQVAIVATPFGDVEVLNVHVPAATSSGVAIKVATFEGIARYLARPATVPRIMCGDFNTPKAEAAGRTSYWGSSHQQGAERAIIEGYATTGLQDVFRHVNGVDAVGASWRASKKVTRRYDHVFASQDLLPVEATYGDLEQVKVIKMSDHAPLRVVLRSTQEVADGVRQIHDVQPPSSVVDRQPTRERITSTPSTREDPSMPTAADVNLQAFLKTLNYRSDVREPPDVRRRVQFRIGWNKASQGPAISDRTLRERLTWANLGYRIGKALGPASEAKIHGVFDQLAALYHRGATEVDQDHGGEVLSGQ